MKFAAQLQVGFVRATRSFSDMRGFGRASHIFNRKFLNAGVPPIQIANMRDGTRMRVDLRSQTEWNTFYSGRYDDAAISFLRKLLLTSGGDFLDVGGNIGMYAVRVAAGINNEQRGLCFEPMPENAARILENAELNEIDDRVQIHQVALSDTEGQTELVLREDFEMGSETGNASVAISEEADGRFRKIQVPMQRFDNILEETGGEFHVAKVDIEGHEDFFLRGAAAWLLRDRPVILTEINNWFYEKRGTTSSAVFAPCLPDEYEIGLLRTNRATAHIEPCSIDELAQLSRVETCILYPAERAQDIEKALG